MSTLHPLRDQKHVAPLKGRADSTPEFGQPRASFFPFAEPWYPGSVGRHREHVDFDDAAAAQRAESGDEAVLVGNALPHAAAPLLALPLHVTRVRACVHVQCQSRTVSLREVCKAMHPQPRPTASLATRRANARTKAFKMVEDAKATAAKLRAAA